ncbi:unnamed protein product [Anthophora quadrimaculata]
MQIPKPFENRIIRDRDFTLTYVKFGFLFRCGLLERVLCSCVQRNTLGKRKDVYNTYRSCIKSHVKTADRAFFRRFPLLYHIDMNFTFALTCMMVAIWLFCGHCETAAELVTNVHRRFRNHPLLRGYAVENLLGEDDDFLDINKRQQFDDYGHMRFGKREQFDDYGHMRFGRNHE